MAQGTKEIHFEEHIENYLVQQDRYTSWSPEEYDKDLCLIPEALIQFIKASQPEKYKKLEEAHQHPSDLDAKIIGNIARNISKYKTLKVLRDGVSDRGVHLDLCTFKPQNNKTPEHETGYEQNNLGLVRQLQYSKRNKNEIDIVLFINGIPVVTLELKNALTGQNHHNAIKQYMQDRDPKGEEFLEFERCLVHFAVGTEKVFMTTKLNGKSTFFLPFNMGLENHNNDGFAVSYLWEDVLKKDSLLDLVQNFINTQKDTKKVYDKKSRKFVETKPVTKLLFPRYHQRRAVKRIIAQLRQDGTGKNYLVQHSAGSGKSNTITWLAYRLANLFRNYDDERGMFDSVIVVTDRRVLNNQIQENIRQFDKTPGMIAYIDQNATSQDLKQAIEDKKRIIITTLQKFPIISQTVTNFPNRNYAILIDEAHSSQSGDAAKHMRKALSLEQAAELDVPEKSVDEIIADDIAKKGQQPNISQFAFTATPKPKTLELFGTDINGNKEPFDVYSMEQAIKEGFILDILKNYMSFKRYYKLVKRSEIPDKEYEKKKTVRILGNFVDLKDHAIESKARIMIEHFLSHTQNQIQGQARAMLVTKSRLHAVRFKRKFDDIMREMKLPYGALVAFSGTVKDDETGMEYTESNMNQLDGRMSIPDAFKLDQFRILIVANKFQTGFDEPLLHTMFVDKKLGGTSTVQTLSRLNRTTRGKDTTMVMDFVNDPDNIQEDFQGYYGKIFMEEENQTDPNYLYDALNKIETFDIIYKNEIEAFADIFFKTEDNFEKLQPILNEVCKRYVDQLNEDAQIDFKKSVQSFNKLYKFLSQIITFTDVGLEKNYIFLKALLKKLPYIKSDMPLDVVNDVELDSYKLQHKFTTDLALSSKDTDVDGMTVGSGGSKDEEDFDWLTKIIETLNDTYGLDLTEEDKVEFNRMKESIYSNEELMGFFNKNNSKDNIKDKFNEEIDSELLNFINTKLDFYNKMTDDKANLMFKSMWFNELYDTMVRKMSK
ncbi:DEAD/DEAH box helicase family protein [Crocinitomicaceae bacterium]|nr:DEAD/DEAH box helicase family protein [Crocinitomicaceae bacterium]